MQERLALLGLALWDLLSVAVSYNFIYWRRLGEWPFLAPGLSVLLLVWISSSYLLSRYSARPTLGWRNSIFLRLTVVVGLVLVVFVFHSWFFVVRDAGTRFRGFLIPLLSVASVLSIAGQMLVRRKAQKVLNWLIVIGDDERDCISMARRWCRFWEKSIE